MDFAKDKHAVSPLPIITFPQVLKKEGKINVKLRERNKNKQKKKGKRKERKIL